MNNIDDIRPLAEFRDNASTYVAELRRTKRPLVLTVDGRVAAVVQDAESYQHLLDLAALADEAEGIRQGVEDMVAGRTRPAFEALDAFRREHDIPR